VTLKPAKVGRAYRQKIARTGGVAPLEWKLLRGKLPKGVTLAKRLGLLLGKPTKAGKYRVAVEAVDALGVKASANLTIVVKK
jgi:Putative Ig domain